MTVLRHSKPFTNSFAVKNSDEQKFSRASLHGKGSGPAIYIRTAM